MSAYMILKTDYCYMLDNYYHDYFLYQLDFFLIIRKLITIYNF